jgi:hypothetical protein
MKKAAFKMCFFCTLLSTVLSTSYADPIPLLTGKPLQALKKTDVKIVEEELNITLTLDQMKVRAVFLFKNPGGQTSFQVGFPCEPVMASMAGMNCQSPLKVTIRGKEVIAKIKAVTEYGRCWVWDMQLSKEEQVRLELEYSAPIVNERYEHEPVFSGIWFIYYPLHTGANWGGPIEGLNISVTIPVETIVQIGPPGHVRKPGLIEWHLSNYEPKDDLFIVMAPQQTSRYIGEFPSANRRTDLDRKRLLDFAGEFLEGIPEYANQYESMVEIFPRFNFPPALGIAQVVRKSYEILRAMAQERRDH